jgi:LysM repeat protein
MSESAETPNESPQLVPDDRCPQCDSVISPGQARCLMCGHELGQRLIEDADELSPGALPTSERLTREQADHDQPEATVLVSVMRERQSRLTFWFTAVSAVVIIVLGALVLRYQGPTVLVAFAPSETPFSPTPTYTATWTPLPTEILLPTATATITPTPRPSETPRPPQLHTVNFGETLIGLALRYRVSVESIAAANGIPADGPIQAQQALLIPWPTATPPLVPVAVTVRGITIVADPTDCERYEVSPGDSLLGIAAQQDVDFELLMRVNRLSEESLLQPGDTLCIPEIVIGGTLPPTPGPSPTISPTSPPPGPKLLYPIANAQIQPPDSIVTLQWSAVKDLTESEWYMVEVSDINEIDSLPRRGFTRDTSIQLPSYWRPEAPVSHLMRWRVSIVQVTGQRSDGAKIYTYGGQRSSDAYFSWFGAAPTPTRQPTPTVAPQT